MRESDGREERGNLEKLGEATGALAGRAADVGMEMTGALFRTAAETLGGWWSSDAPVQAAGAWSERAERDCRSHYEGIGAKGGASAGAGVDATDDTSDPPPPHVVRKSKHGAMQSAGLMTTDTEGNPVSGLASIGVEGASDGFANARAGYQLGYVARRNPDYRNRSFAEVEPELRKVWETRAKTEGSDATGTTSEWPDVRGFVDFAYQKAE